MREVMNASGRMINPYALKPEDFDPKVIAQTLSRICRFWGQTSKFYSVAQHCLAMESLFDDIELKRWSIGHEVFEGLTGMDIPSPIKHSSVMKSYRDAEDRALEMFADIYGLSKPTPDIIKVADKRMMVTEALCFMNNSNYDWLSIAEPYDLSVITSPMSMEEAEATFLERWFALFNN